jgi:hypothetical protein
MASQFQKLIVKILKKANKTVTRWTANNYECFGDDLVSDRIRAKDGRSCLDNYFISLLAFAELKDKDSFFRVKEKFDENYGPSYDPSIRDKRVLEMTPDYLPEKDSELHNFLKEQLGNYPLYNSIEQLLN